MVVMFIVNYVGFIFWLITPSLSMNTGSLGKSELLHVICLIIKREFSPDYNPQIICSPCDPARMLHPPNWTQKGAAPGD